MGKYDEAYYALKDGLQARLKEDPNIEIANDFQIHHLYILHHFLGYDTSPEAIALRNQLKALIRAAGDDETKVIFYIKI